jgi:sterol 3beta-glucosyltransferase
MPWSPTGEFNHPLVNVKSSDAPNRLTNYLSYGLAEIMTWQGLGPTINKFRRKELLLNELQNGEGPGLADRLKIPHIYCWSPTVIPKPKDWKAHIGERQLHLCFFSWRR